MRFEVQKKFFGFWAYYVHLVVSLFFMKFRPCSPARHMTVWRYLSSPLLLGRRHVHGDHLGKKDVSRARQWCMGHADMGGHWSIARTTQFYMLKLYCMKQSGTNFMKIVVITM